MPIIFQNAYQKWSCRVCSVGFRPKVWPHRGRPLRPLSHFAASAEPPTASTAFPGSLSCYSSPFWCFDSLTLSWSSTKNRLLWSNTTSRTKDLPQAQQKQRDDRVCSYVRVGAQDTQKLWNKMVGILLRILHVVSISFSKLCDFYCFEMIFFLARVVNQGDVLTGFDLFWEIS